MRQVLVGLAFLGVIGSAHAINFQHYQFNDSYRYSILDDSIFERFTGDYVITSSFAHVNQPVYVSDEDVTKVYSSFINYNNLLTLGASYHVHTELTVSANIAYLDTSVANEKRNSVTDSNLKLKYNLYRDKTYSLSINPTLYLPTGKQSTFSTHGSLAEELLLVGETKQFGFNFLGSIGFRHAKDNAYSIIDYRNLLLMGLGASYDFSKEFSTSLEITRDFTMAKDYRQNMGGYYLNAKYALRQNVSLFGGVGVAGVNEIDRDTYTGFVGIKVY